MKCNVAFKLLPDNCIFCITFDLFFVKNPELPKLKVFPMTFSFVGIFSIPSQAMPI